MARFMARGVYVTRSLESCACHIVDGS